MWKLSCEGMPVCVMKKKGRMSTDERLEAASVRLLSTKNLAAQQQDKSCTWSGMLSKDMPSYFLSLFSLLSTDFTS